MTTPYELRGMASLYDDGHAMARAMRAAASRIEKLQGELLDEQKITNNYINFLHGAERERDKLKAKLDAIDEFMDSLLSDFWKGCSDPQSNFDLSCKHEGCLQCRLIAWRKIGVEP